MLSIDPRFLLVKAKHFVCDCNRLAYNGKKNSLGQCQKVRTVCRESDLHFAMTDELTREADSGISNVQ